MKLAWRISISFTILLMITSLILTYVFHQAVMSNHEADHVKWSSTMGNALAKVIMSDMLAGKKFEVGNTSKSVTKNNPDILYVVVIGFDRKVFSSTLDGKLPHELADLEHQRVGSNLTFHMGQREIQDISFPIINNLDANIHLGLDERSFSDSVNDAIFKTGIASLLILLATIPFAALIARRISRPIKQLTESVEAFGRDEFFDISHIKGGGREVRLLVNSFERMVDERKQFELQIQRTNEKLEERVLQRTTDLTAAKDEADRANRAKSEFLSNMSHELRTPMNAILGFGQLLEYDETLSDENKDNVHEILKAGAHLLELINEVLDLAKIEAGHIDLSLEPVEVCPIVAECLSLVNALANKRGIKLSHKGLEGMSVRADRTRLKQALLNLISNAIKYNREGGSVHIEMQTAATDRLCIRVTDTGSGIPDARLAELFLPFNRLDAENSGIEGTGIGLTITRRIVEMMGGTVDVKSEVGVGSTFWIELPLESMRCDHDSNGVAAESNTPVSCIEAIQQLVLYIEDNPANLKLVAQILGRLKHIHLLTAHTPELGIELALARRPDLILLDINMPHMDGYQVMEILKSDANLKDIPVIAVTANAMDRDIERGMAAGFVDYLTKPLNIEHFLKTIALYLTAEK